MTDEVRAIATTAYTMFVFDFADLDGVNKTKLEEKIKHPLVELFDKQRNADIAKKTLKEDFKKLVALYFHNYQTAQGFNFSALADKLDLNEQVFARHLGKDKVRLLRLLTSIARVVQEKPKRGLLDAA